MAQKRLKRWKLLWWLLHGFITRRFQLEAERLVPPGPCLIIANHVTNWDPLLLAMSFPETPSASWRASTSSVTALSQGSWIGSSPRSRERKGLRGRTRS